LLYQTSTLFHIIYFSQQEPLEIIKKYTLDKRSPKICNIYFINRL